MLEQGRLRRALSQAVGGRSSTRGASQYLKDDRIDLSRSSGICRIRLHDRNEPAEWTSDELLFRSRARVGTFRSDDPNPAHALHAAPVIFDRPERA